MLLGLVDAPWLHERPPIDVPVFEHIRVCVLLEVIEDLLQ